MAASILSPFPPTRWTLIQRVRAGSEAEARAALELLCRAYWQPLYSVARRRGLPEHDASDAVQGFFESLLRHETFAGAEEAVGRLRHFLLAAFDHYCTQQWQKAQRQKRGGGAEHLNWDDFRDSGQAEQQFIRSAGQQLSVEVLYKREWATAVLDRSLQNLREEYASRGWTDRYELLVRPLLQQEDGSLEQLAAGVGTTAAALRQTLHRMRTHYREAIERELALTLDTDDPRLIREELKELFKAFT